MSKHNRPMRHLAAFVLVLILFLAGCSTAEHRDFDYYSFFKAHPISKEMAPTDYERAYRLSEKICRVIVPELKRYDVVILDSGIYRAGPLCFECYSDGSDLTMVISMGMLKDFSDEEFLLILAHEWSHFALGHNAEVRDAIRNNLSEDVQNRISFRHELEADRNAVEVMRQHFKITPEKYIAVLHKLRDGDAHLIKLDSRVRGNINKRIERVKECIQK